MTRRLAVLAFLLLAACTKRQPAPPDAAVVDAATPIPDAGPSIPDAGPPLDLASDGGLAALLEGEASAKKLPEVATDDAGVIDRGLRKRLTTVELPSHDGLGDIGEFPKGAVVIDGTAASSPIADADRVMASLRPRLRACYENGLRTQPSMVGKLVVSATIDKDGNVTGASVTTNTGASTIVTGCVVRVLRLVHLDAPAGGNGATLTIPITFSPAK